jgi:hypothetical protein
MGRLRALRRIILPQAMRVVIPPLGNEFIGMVKATSLASVIQYPEVLHNAENIYYANSRVIELLIVAGSWYLLVVSILTPCRCFSNDASRVEHCRSPDDPAPRRHPFGQQELWGVSSPQPGLAGRPGRARCSA